MLKFYLDKKDNRLWYKVKIIKGTYDWNNDGDEYYDEYVRYASLDGNTMDVLASDDVSFDKELSYPQAREWLADLLDGYFKPSSMTMDNMENGIIDAYTDPTHNGKYHYSYGNLIKGGLNVAGTETDRKNAVAKEVEFVFKGLKESSIRTGFCLSEALILTGLSVKSFRNEVFEASGSFASGSLSDAVFKFYKELKTYYSDLLAYQFQLYSDRPPYILGIESIKVNIGGEVKFFVFGTGKAKDLSGLQALDGMPFNAASEITYRFEIAPQLKDLLNSSQNNINKDLFVKTRDISVNKGDGTYLSAKFEPEWTDYGVILRCNGIVSDNKTPAKMFSLSGGI